MKGQPFDGRVCRREFYQGLKLTGSLQVILNNSQGPLIRASQQKLQFASHGI